MRFSLSALAGLSAALLSAPAMASLYHDYSAAPEDAEVETGNFLDRWSLPFIPVPKIITEPAVGTGLALGLVFFQESEEQKAERSDGSLVPENITLGGLAFTSNGSRGYGVGHLGFWKDDTIRYKGFLAFSDFNIDFYSLAGMPINRPIGFNIKGPAVIQQLQMRVGDSRWLIGAKQVYRTVKLTLTDDISLPNAALADRINRYLDQHLGDSTTTSGLGITAEFDSLDTPIDPQEGYNYRFRYLVYNKAIGSDYDYASYQLKGTNYWTLSPKWDLGVRLQYDGISVDDQTVLPAYIAPSIDLRGIPAARYQGNAVAVTEAELTWKITPRWRLKTFAGAGRAADQFSDLSDAEAANSIGGGFRYMVAERYGFNMGIDVARGPEESAVYIQAGSTW
ncbi:BamA/TamA family outer membrane protein [Halopseudomonas sabulinigri]|uniref:BamA/TamA family outer membrane protein n=1 Tax=Halopseudomonas sabulinigri TaxID=472181 RepID=A0ABP9ZLM3_9GAMM